MTLQIKLRHLTVGIVVVALLAGGGYALATTRDRVIRVCVNGRTRALTMPANARCGKGSTALAWNQQGPKGPTGAKGARGASGSPGTPATVSIGAVSTGAAGSQANVTNVGSASNAKLDFTIPQGEAGTNGTDGTNTGPTAYGQVWMGTSAAELATGSGQNVVSVAGENGAASVEVDNCNAPTPTEPIITVTPDKDAGDTLAGANDTANTVGAYVTGFDDGGSPGDHTVEFEVETFNPIPTTNTVVNSDFSFTVIC
jgi:hypothetical protein